MTLLSMVAHTTPTTAIEEIELRDECERVARRIALDVFPLLYLRPLRADLYSGIVVLSM
jgi:hypothetical protein